MPSACGTPPTMYRFTVTSLPIVRLLAFGTVIESGAVAISPSRFTAPSFTTISVGPARREPAGIVTMPWFTTILPVKVFVFASVLAGDDVVERGVVAGRVNGDVAVHARQRHAERACPCPRGVDARASEVHARLDDVRLLALLGEIGRARETGLQIDVAALEVEMVVVAVCPEALAERERAR